MKKLFIVLILACSCTVNDMPNLLPKPQEVEWGKGWTRLENASVIKKELNGQQSEEAYTLTVTKDSVIIKADSQIGFLRAEQTLDQLTENGKVRCCTIYDFPAYEWRGAMLDVSRHFLTIDFLKKHIDILASYKINRLHLHLTDAAGWRMEIKKYPLLTGIAAWRPQEIWKDWWSGDRLYVEEGSADAHGGYYTQDELRELVGYADERGILVVPEIEMPSHSEEVLAVYPELSCTHVPYKQSDFCIGNPATFEFLENVLLEVMDVFPSKYIHIGGDEAGKGSWKTCPLCQGKMKKLGLKDVDALQAHLIEHMGNFLAEHGRELVGWDEVLDETLPENSTVMIWRGVDITEKATSMGYDVIVSPGSHCYLDSYQDAPATQPEAIGGYLPLEKVYGYDPAAGLSEAEKSHIKGIQGNVWAEYIPTQEHREYMLYPRILAIAEIGWNGTEVKDYDEFYGRALVETERLRAEGVNAFDLRNEIGERPESKIPAGHKAVGAKVTYNLPLTHHYMAGGETALTDGIRGGWTYGDGRWQGFIRGERLDVTIDLGESMDLSRVCADFMQSCGPEIYFPASFTVSVSEDGENFTELCHELTPVVKSALTEIKEWKWEGQSRGRYVRVKATAGEFSGWIFLDEIEIY